MYLCFLISVNPGKAPSFIDTRKHSAVIPRFQYSEQASEARTLQHGTWLGAKCCAHSACCGSSQPRETCFSPGSSGLHTSTIACWADLDVCLLYGNFGGKNPKHKLWVEILTVSLVPWCSPCLICTFHRGCFCIAYTALAQEIVAL